MKKSNNHWFILLAILIILVIAILLPSASILEKKEEKRKRDEEEGKLLAELEELERKQEIQEKHQFFNKFTQDYLNEICEKRYHQLIKVLIALLIVTNVVIYLLVPKVEFLNLITWNGIALGGLNLTAIYFFLSVKKGKEYLKGLAMNYIEYRVYENRDKNYYSLKMEMYKNEIEITKKDIDIKKLELNDLSENTPLESPDKLIDNQ